MEQKLCQKCNSPILDTYFFCPNCGKKIKEPPLATGIGKQIKIYLLSIILPPLGLWPGFKYLSQKDEKERLIGLVAIILTILSIVFTVWVTIGFINGLNKTLNSQLNQFQNLRY